MNPYLRSFCRGSVLTALGISSVAHAQAPGKWPPDSLVNTQVFPHSTPVTQLWGQMRNAAFGLGVECTYCHMGGAGAPLAQIDFISDDKRNKLVARQMFRMVDEINRRLDSIPGRPKSLVRVTCETCHRGVARPVPLLTIISDAAIAASADSAIATYNSLRARYYGRDAYDFSEPTLTSAAFLVGRAGKYADAFRLLDLNERLFPNSSPMSVIRGNIHLMRRDTTSAEAAFREALRRNPANDEARGRLRAIKREP
jgi:hypothetical protein